MTPDASRPDVSVIVPVYNASKTLDETVRSVLNQTLASWELLLVDDGSTDTGGPACDRFAAEDLRIRAFHTPNGGYGRARNLGLSHARGEWVLFLDSDDTLAPHALGHLLAGSIGVGAVMALYQTVPYPTMPKEDVPGGIYEYPGSLSGALTGLYEPYFLLSVWGKMYRRELLDTGFDLTEGDIMGDWLFNFRRLPDFRRICFLPETLYYYRVDGRPTHSVHFHSEWLYAAKGVYRRVLTLFPDQSPITSFMARRYVYRVGQYVTWAAALPRLTSVQKLAMLSAERSDPFYDLPAIRDAEYAGRYLGVWRAFMSGSGEAALEAAQRFSAEQG